MIKSSALLRWLADVVGFRLSKVLDFSKAFCWGDRTKERSLPIALMRVVHCENLKKWLVPRNLLGKIWVAKACTTGRILGTSAAVSEAWLAVMLTDDSWWWRKHADTELLTIYWSCGQISRILVSGYKVPLFRRWRFPYALYPVADRHKSTDAS